MVEILDWFSFSPGLHIIENILPMLSSDIYGKDLIKYQKKLQN